jgi:hypothetical protein
MPALTHGRVEHNKACPASTQLYNKALQYEQT